MTPQNQLPPELAALVGAELEAGERIAWVGQPDPRRFAWASVFAVLFAIPWTAFAIFWMCGAAGFKMPTFQHGWDLFPLFGLPFVLVGFGMLSTPYWLRRKAQRTVYVITDRRAVILDGGWWRSITVRSFSPDRLKDLRRVQRPDGSGDLLFERTWRTDSEGSRQFTDHGFLGVRDVKMVERLIKQLTQSAGPQTP